MAGSQAVLERLDHVELFLAGRGLEVAYPIDLPRLLRLGGKRRGEQAKDEDGDNAPAVILTTGLAEALLNPARAQLLIAVAGAWSAQLKMENLHHRE